MSGLVAARRIGQLYVLRRADLPLLLDKELEKNFRDLIEMLKPDRQAVYLDQSKTWLRLELAG